MHRLRVLCVSGPRGKAARSLATALAATDVDVRVVSALETDSEPAGLARRLRPLSVAVPVGPVEVPYYEGRLPSGGVDVVVAECDRDTLPAFALELCRSSDQWPHIIHASDEAAAVVPLAKRATIAPVGIVDLTGANPQAQIAPELETALEAADRIVVESPAVARRTTASDGALAHLSARVCGIAPGIDAGRWDAKRDPHLPEHFSVSDRSGKTECKLAVQRERGLAVRSRVPLVWICGDVDAETLAALESLRCQVAVDPGDDEATRHRLAAAADFVVVAHGGTFVGSHPLSFMRYGAIPIAPVGTDELVDFHKRTRTGNAFLYAPEAGHLTRAVRRAVDNYRTPSHPTLVKRAMTQDLSWETTALRFHELYRRALLA